MHGKWSVMLVASLVVALAEGAIAAERTDGPELYVGQDGVKVRFVDQGQGEPVILLHGFSMNLDWAWQTPGAGPGSPSILTRLAAHHRVIAVDLRGHGKSDRPHDCDRYGTAMADDVLRLMDALRIRKASLVGFSMGGTIAANLAVRHPERFRRVVLLAPKVELTETLVDGRDPGMDVIAQGLEKGEGLRPLFRALTPPGAPPMSEDEIEAQNERILRGQDPAALACAARTLGQLAVPGPALDGIKLPVLVVVGSQDPLLAGAREVVKRVHGAKLRVIDGATHPALLSSPQLLPELQPFLARR